jgi:RPA family protein
VVDAATRDRWVVETAERTIDRLQRFDEEGNEYAAMAREQYDLPVETYRDQAIAALESLDDGELAEPEADQPADAD